MGVVWQIAISNAVLVAAGTPLVWLVGRYGRRPALTHALAVLLLLKLLTPPLWRVPLAWPKGKPAAPIANTMNVTRSVQPLAEPAPPVLIEPRITTSGGTNAPDVAPDLPLTPIVSAAPAPAPSQPEFDLDRWRGMVLPLLGWVWIAGTALCVFVAAVRIVRFIRALRFAIAVTDLQPRANLMARRLGLRQAPAVWFVPAAVPPMLWSVGRPRLLIPHALWQRLDVTGRDTILLHELAHYRRGDHVIRWIELIATCLYWWHPCCWWARRELREAEEQCCDAWVLWAMPGIFKNYANALLEAVEFASFAADRPSARKAVPALASRMGQFVHLRRRLTMLKHGNIARALSWGGLAGVMTLGSFLLPVAPTWAQQQPTPETPATQGQAAPATATTPPAPAPPSPVPLTREQEAQLQFDRARESVSAAEVAKAQQTIAVLQRQLAIAQARLRDLEDRARQLPAGPSLRSYAPATPSDPAAPASPEPPPYQIHAQGPGSIRTVIPPPAAQPPVAVSPAAPAEPAPGTIVVPSSPNGRARVFFRDPNTGRVSELEAATIEIHTPPPPEVAHESQAQRLDKIESQLRMLMDEIAKMRQTPVLPSSDALR